MIPIRDTIPSRHPPVAELDDQTLILADQAEKAIKQVRESVRELLRKNYEPAKADELARLLSEGTWTHDHPITYDDARALGLHVNGEMPKEVYQIMTLFPQPVRQQPSVEYIPLPRRTTASQPTRREVQGSSVSSSGWGI